MTEQEREQEQQRILGGMLLYGYSGHAVNDLYSCDECNANVRFVGRPDAVRLDYCPECGESRDGIMVRILVVGDPIVLGEARP